MVTHQSTLPARTIAKHTESGDLWVWNRFREVLHNFANFSSYLVQHDDEMHSERERTDDYYSKKPKKPDPYYQEYQSKQNSQQQQTSGGKSEKARYERSYENRQSRQGSEPRGSANANYSNQDSIKNNFSSSDRNRDRDTRSSEPGGGHHYEHRNKPPSGLPRISNSAFQRLPLNLESLPPRLKKKCLKDAGLPEDLTQKQIMEMTQQSYSNTLPSGRGRNNRYDQQNYHHQNYQSKYNNNNQNQGYHNDQDSNFHRSITPPPSKSSRPQPQQQPKPAPSRYDWNTNDVQRRDESSPTSKTPTTPVARPLLTSNDDAYFDWTDEVLNSQSLPPEVISSSTSHNKPEDNNRHRHRRRRNRR